MGDVEYFCYLSRNKIDQLYEQLDPDAGSEIIETRRSEREAAAETKVNWGIPHFLSLFQTGGSYGRKGMVQREAKVKHTYWQKLQVVLLALAAKSPIPPLDTLMEDGEPELAGAYCHYQGRFMLDEPVDDPRVDAVVTLRSSVGNRSLLLDCSLRNFSEGPMPDGRFRIDSANERFFKGEFALPMTTVLLVLAASPERVVGSPLFLKLSLPNNNSLLAL
jgi:hypothetical protein